MWNYFEISMNFPNYCSSLAFLILWKKGGGGISCTNLGVVLISGISVGNSAIEIFVPEVVRLGCSVCTLSCLSLTKWVIVCIDGSSDTSYDVIFFLSWSVFYWLNPLYYLPLLNEMTWHVSMFFVPDVDVGILVDLESARSWTKCRSNLSNLIFQFFDAYTLSLK